MTNPTEFFIEELMDLLNDHEEITGTYINTIKIGRFSRRNIEDARETHSQIIDIKLEIS